MIKLLEENRTSTLHWVRKRFLKQDVKPRTIKKYNTDQMNFIKIKTFVFQKSQLRKQKGSATYQNLQNTHLTAL